MRCLCIFSKRLHGENVNKKKDHKKYLCQMFKSDIDEIILVLNEMECFFVSHKYMKQVQLMYRK